MQKISFLQKIKILQQLNKRALLASLLLASLPLTALAEDGKDFPQPQTVQENITNRVKGAEDNNYLSLSFENDRIGNGKDQNYTSGIRLTYYEVNTPVPPVIDKFAEAIPTFDLNTTTSTFFTIGQNLYTPQDITQSANQPNERPWAGWLYGSVGLTTITKNHLDELEFTLGVVGPQALGKQTQKFIHNHLTNSPDPKGWDNQLKTEPGVVISARRRWPILYAQNFDNYRLRIEPNVNLSLGNVYTYAGTGLAAAFGPGKNTAQDMPPRVQPAMAGTGFFDTPNNKLSWYLFGGIDTRLIARNIFLDGNTFKNSPSVSKFPVVADGNIGLALTYDDYRLAYTLNYRTKEFDGQDNESVFGSLTFTTRF